MKLRYVSNTGKKYAPASIMRKVSSSPKMIEAAQSMHTREVGPEAVFVGVVSQRLHLNRG